MMEAEGEFLQSFFAQIWSIFDGITLPFFWNLKLSTVYMGFFVSGLSIGILGLLFGFGSGLGSGLASFGSSKPSVSKGVSKPKNKTVRVGSRSSGQRSGGGSLR